MSITFTAALVTWNTVDNRPLQAEQLEALRLSSLKLNSDEAKKGMSVGMLYRKKLWSGTISSLHETLSEAKIELEKIIGKEELDASVDEPSSEHEQLPSRRQRRPCQPPPLHVQDLGSSESEDGADELSIVEQTTTESSTSPRRSPRKRKLQAGKSGGRGEKSKKKKNKESQTKRKQESTTVPRKKKLNQRPLETKQKDDLVDLILNSNSEVNVSEESEVCFNQKCIQEKNDLHNKISKLEEELDAVKAKAIDVCETTPKGLSSKYMIRKEEAEKKGWQEIADNVWCCPIKLKSAISSSSTKTSLVGNLLLAFYEREDIAGKRLNELDQRIVSAIIDFSLAAKVGPSPDKPKQDKDHEKKPPKLITKGTLRQALNVKLNQMIFTQKKPTYHKEKYQALKREGGKKIKKTAQAKLTYNQSVISDEELSE